MPSYAAWDARVWTRYWNDSFLVQNISLLHIINYNNNVPQPLTAPSQTHTRYYYYYLKVIYYYKSNKIVIVHPIINTSILNTNENMNYDVCMMKTLVLLVYIEVH